MDRKYRRIGISGGTFDPIHYGHLITAESIRERLELEKVLFIPSGMPPHKTDLKVSEGDHRFNMVQSAVSINPHFEASRIEIERPGYTYTVDTLTQLNTFYGPEVKLFFITGADVIPELTTWKSIDKVFTLCEFVAVLRPGYMEGAFKKEIEFLKANYSAVIHIVDVPLIEISSTVIREKVKRGRSIKFLVPGCVEEYILEKGLYR